MYIDRLEPTNVEEFLYLKDYLSKYYPVLQNLEFNAGEVIPQIIELLGISKEQFEQEIQAISSKEIIKHEKIDSIYRAITELNSAQDIERETGIPVTDFERAHLEKMGAAWFVASIREVIIYLLIYGTAMCILHPLIFFLLILGSLVLNLFLGANGYAYYAYNRIISYVLNTIEEGDKK